MSKKKRNLEGSRAEILHAAFAEIYSRGFNKASIDLIVKSTDFTKGALFNQFPTKAKLGVAVVEEVIGPVILSKWVTPLVNASDPVPVILDQYRIGIDYLKTQTPILGCPLNNLALEISQQEPAIAAICQHYFQLWEDSFTEAFSRGAAAGTFHWAGELRDCARFCISSIEGTLTIGKITQDPEQLESGYQALAGFLTGVRQNKDQ